MLNYNFPMVYIGNLANLKSSLHFSDRITCSVYDSEGLITERCQNGSIYNLVIRQDIVDGEPQVDLALYETVETGAPRFTLSHGTFRKTKVRDLFVDDPDLSPNNPWTIEMWNAEEPYLPGVQAPRCNFYDVPRHIPAAVFDNLEYCELLILVTGGYVIIKQGWGAPDDASKDKIVNLHDAMALLTGY
ncbi:hypothetical protein ACOBQJ_09715 [Pelotomaculum propionicicum]|uniref:hypothetical protein n=1 Tax=Pelotomaculum propionicicum TaxID=258475 RepID=UPI003B8139EF